MECTSKIFVAGGTGMVGSAITGKLFSAGYTRVVSNYHKRRPLPNPDADRCELVQLDLTRQADVERFFEQQRPEYVFLAAARVGGILANSTYPADFIYENLAIETNVIHASHRYGVGKLLFLGSSCIYPKLAPQPMKEEHLLTGELEPTNEPYAVAKIAGIKLCQSYNRQYGTDFISAMPTNLYGPLDNFDLETSHVLPALIRKFHEAKQLNAGGSRFEVPRSGGKDARGSALNMEQQTLNLSRPAVVVWGTGTPRREFLHVEDLADACLFLMRNYRGSEIINIGTGTDITIRELAGMVKRITGYEGEIVWDRTRPDGTPRKLLDISRIKALGWSPEIALEDGIRMTYEWYVRHTGERATFPG